MKQVLASSIKKYNQSELGLIIEVADDILSEIKSAALQHYPKEFGGILLGRYERNSKVAVIEKMLLPTKYRNTRIHFERKAEKLNERIKKEFEASNGTIIYIGEWHSHPDCSPTPSETDKSAIKEIALSKTVMIENPVLLIIEIGKKIFNPKFYVYHKQNLLQYDEQH